MALVASTCVASPSHAISGSVRVTVAKAALVVGGGGGRGVLTCRHRKYPFTVRGLSLGVTAGASINRLVGRRRIRDLVALAAFQGLSENEIGCARISMMAPGAMLLRSRAGYRSARPIISRSSHSACNARPVHSANNRSRISFDHLAGEREKGSRHI